MVRAHVHLRRILRRGESLLAVLRHVYRHGPGLAVGRYVEGLGHRLGYLVSALHEEVVLRHCARHPLHVSLLEGIGSDLRKRNLTRDDYHWHAVQVRRGEARYRVRRAGTGRHKAYARLARGARIGVGHVRRALLVPSQDEPERRILQAVEYVEHRPAGIAEHNLGSSLLERLHKRHGAGSLFSALHLRPSPAT